MNEHFRIYGAMLTVVAGLLISTAQSVQAQICGASVTTVNATSSGTNTSINGASYTVNADPGECGANEFHWVFIANGCAPATITCTKDGSNESEMCTLDNNGNNTYTVGGNFPVGMSTVKCTVTSSCGTANADFLITVEDKQNPVVTVPQNAEQEADAGQCCATVAYQASVADNCPGLGCNTCDGPTVSCNPRPGTCFPVGSTTVTCTGTDGSNNTDTKTFQVIVTDQQPPVIACPEFQVVAAVCDNTADLVGPTATDNCPTNDLVITCNPPLNSANFPPGIHEVCCDVTDTGNAEPDGQGGPTEPVSKCCFQVLVVGPAVGDIIWHAPTAQDPANHDTDPHMTSATAYIFKVNNSIPVQVHVEGCPPADSDITASVCGRVEVYYDAVCSAGPTVDITENYTGVGDPGGEMEHINGHLKYNLKTDRLQYPSGTVNTTACFELHVVIYDCTSGLELFRERIIMESRP